MTVQTLSGPVASAVVSRVREQRGISRDSGCTLYEAGAVLAIVDAERREQEASRWDTTEATADLRHALITEGGISEQDAARYGVRWVRDYGAAGADKRKGHAARLEQSTHAHPLQLLAIRQYVDVRAGDMEWTEWFPLGRRGFPITRKRQAAQSTNARRTAGKPRRAARKGAVPMSQTERNALSKWRKVARAEGYTCPEHGQDLKPCRTECRTRALSLTDQTGPVAVAESAGRGW